MAAINYDFPLDPNGHNESELITALYLYGDKVTVQNGNVIIPEDEALLDSSLIREELIIPAGTTNPNDIDIDIIEVQVDEVDYMTNGPGRFANGYQFDLVKAFFGQTAAAMRSKNGRENYKYAPALLKTFGSANYDSQGNLISRTYTRQDIDQIYFQNLLEGYSANLELRDYDDGTDNFDQRIYTWNSQQFSLPDSIEFVVYFDPTDSDKIIGREIKNFHIDPNVRTNYDFKENFDFDTANPIVEAASKLLLEPRVDPSGIGRTVYFNFANRDSPQDFSYLYDPVKTGDSLGTYDRDDFNQDSIKELNSFLNYSFPVSAANAGVRTIAEANKVFDLGVTEFLYKDKPLLYGTVDDDNLKASNLTTSNFPLQIDKAKNGVVLLGGQGNDTIKGDVNGGVSLSDDILVGHEGNDNLDGRGGEDTAIYFDSYTDEDGNPNYDISTNDDTGVTTIAHSNGGIDGTDTLKNIEFAQFNVSSDPNVSGPPRIIPLPLEDGVEDTAFIGAIDTTASPNPNDPPTPPNVALTAPVAMLDGDVDYTLNISPYEPDTEYNVVYVIDTSASIDSAELQTIKDAYTDLTNFYINEDIAENINFGVVSYDSSGRFHPNAGGGRNLTADEALVALQNLTIDTGIGTRYYDGLNQADQFLLNSRYNPFFTTGIGYFITDGQNSGDRFDMLLKARDVREFANFQAIGYYQDLDTLTSNSLKIRDVNWIDSNQGVFIDNLDNLSTELLKSDLADDVESVNILVDGEVVDTLTPDQFTDSPLGLTYEGTVENLDVSEDAENIVTAEVVFTPESNLAVTTVEHTVTAGDSQAVDENGNPIDQSGNNTGDGDEDEDPFERQLNGGDGNDEITLGYVDRGANGGAGGDYIVGNNRDNILDGGAGNDTIIAHGGDDTITTGAGNDKVDGGEGIDTVLYSDVAYQGNNSIFLTQAANTVNYNNTDTLTDVEFIQFSDVRISGSTLEITPILTVSDANIIEGETASVNLELSTPAPVDITFDYSTADIDAVAEVDYTPVSGEITIPAGQTTASLNLDTVDDSEAETFEALGLNLSALSGATFENDRTEYSTAITIEDNDDDPIEFGNVIAEYGTIDNLGSGKQTIDLTNTYTNPVVFVQPPSANDGDPALVRLENIDSDSFDARIQEPNHLDDAHTDESASYFVFEAGSWQLEDGTLLEVGKIGSSGLVNQKGFDLVEFDREFPTSPVIISQVQTNNDSDFVRTRQRNATTDGFSISMEEEEANQNSGHASEEIGWLAIESGSGSWGDSTYYAGQTGTSINHNWSNIDFNSLFDSAPQLMASLSSINGPDPSGLRYRNKDSNGIEIKLEEDTSLDAETGHTNEVVDFLAVEGEGTLSALPTTSQSQIFGEVGTVNNFNHNNQTIELENTYTNPVIFAMPLSVNGGDPAVARITDIQNDSFSVYAQEAEYLDGFHANESFSYLVLEAGTWELESGAILEVGTTDTDQIGTPSWENIEFDNDFSQPPVILSQVQTDNDSEFVRTRQRNKSIDGFELIMEEEEALRFSGHGSETVGWLAIEPGSGNVDGFDYTAESSEDVNHNFKTIDFDNVFDVTPNILASVSSINGPDPSGLRYRNLGMSGVEMKVEEDWSVDNELGHANESVDWLAIGGVGSLSATPVDSFI